MYLVTFKYNRRQELHIPYCMIIAEYKYYTTFIIKYNNIKFIV